MDSKSAPYHAIFDARRHSLQRQQGIPKIIPISETPPNPSGRKEYEYSFPAEAATLQQQLRKTIGFLRKPKEKSAPHVVDLTTSFKEQTPKTYFRPKSSEGYPPVSLPNKYTRTYRPQSHSASVNSTRSTTPVQSNRESANPSIQKERDKGFQILNHDQENGIYYLRNPNYPNQILIKRNKEKPDKESEKMKLENRDMKTFPIITDAEQLKVLSLEHNNIEVIENTIYLHNLVYLDLYDNGIKKIEGLNHLTQLRVLMLGKNRIKSISGLKELTQLDVLDLHSNEIEMVNELDSLTLLRVLNLAGNKINSISGFDSLISLIELNLKKNFIGKCEGMPLLPRLQRLYLSENKIATIQRLNPLQSITTLSDISLEGNPLCSIKYYRYQLILSFQQIKVLDSIEINEEERRRATSIVTTKHISHPSSASSQREQLNNYIKENSNINPNNGRSTSLGFTHSPNKNRNPNNIITPIHQSPTQNTHKKLLTSTSITTITSNSPDINTESTTPTVAFQQPQQPSGKPPKITTINVNTKVPYPPSSSSINPIPPPSQEQPKQQQQQQQQQLQLSQQQQSQPPLQPQPSPVNAFQKTLQSDNNNENKFQTQINTQTMSPKPLNRLLKRNTTPTVTQQLQPQQTQQQNTGKMKSKDLFIGSEQFVQLSNDSYPDYITHIIFENNDIHFIHQHINKLKRYKCLTALSFSNANINDFKQLEFINTFSHQLTSIEVSLDGNTITHCKLFRLFMIHYFPFLNTINREDILPEERFNSKRYFPNLQELRPLPTVTNDTIVEEFSSNYIDNIVNETIKIENRIEVINDTWSKYIHDVVNSFEKEDDDQSYMDHCLDHLIDNIK